MPYHYLASNEAGANQNNMTTQEEAIEIAKQHIGRCSSAKVREICEEALRTETNPAPREKFATPTSRFRQLQAEVDMHRKLSADEYEHMTRAEEEEKFPCWSGLLAIVASAIDAPESTRRVADYLGEQPKDHYWMHRDSPRAEWARELV